MIQKYCDSKICLSVHWISSEKKFGSSVYCNGKKLSTFTASVQGTKRNINTKSMLGSIQEHALNKDIYKENNYHCFKGDVFSLIVFKNNNCNETFIKQMLTYFMEHWGIT